MTNKKILIIEDENFLLDMYRMKFEKEGYTVFTSLTGEEGVRIAQKEKPDLILLDLVMPKMDGYQVLKKLKADKRTKDIKVYILSNLGQDGEIVKGFDEGADGFLIKANLTPGQLSEDVKKIFAGKSAGLKRPTTKLPKISADKKKDSRGQSYSNPRGARILLIENEETIVEMYKMRLEKEGYRVEVALDWKTGFDLVKVKEFDVLILDLVMPTLDNYAVISRIRNNSKNSEARIIVLCDSAQERDYDRVKQRGAARFLIKSDITPAKLVREIGKVLK